MSDSVKPKMRRAVLSAAFMNQLGNIAIGTKGGDRLTDRCVNELMDLLISKMVKFKDEDGVLSWDFGQEKFELEFSDRHLFAVKAGMIQVINGDQRTPPASFGLRRFTLFPICRELGIEKAVRKACSLDGDEEKVEIELDDAPEPVKE